MSLLDIVRISALLMGAAVLVIVFSLAELFTQLGRYKNFWDQNNAQAALSSQQVYVAFGDSAAQGVGASKATKSYVSVIAENIENSSGQDLAVVNLSKSGAKIKDVIDTQLPAYEKLNIKSKPIITIEIGANDIVSFDDKLFEKQMDELMGRLPKQTIISDIPYFGGSRFKKLQPKVDVANEIMYRLAEKHGFELAGLHDRVKTNGGFKVYAADWFHPSDYSYRTNWAAAFIEQLETK